ncbi:MAG: topoisomerase DNA-binding C4 zinc finger domain-containing protein, partial [Xanthobacteraceae bacterium]|nr:topoisomerase DNA-binding C4 zinc finger domain-containing protein [Xanthobacteraceae bacterium]
EGIDIGGDTVGLITYMRTDGVQIADEAIAAIRTLIGNEYGKSYVPDGPRRYQAKAKNAQEAHEAIRPTDVSRLPRSLRGKLDADQARLYELIWQRAVASQMESAEIERTTVDITAKVGARVLELRATGSVVKFDGFLKLYQEGRDDDPEDEESRRLPAMSAGEPLTKREITATQHFTEPPPRYSEASLVKRMEELGIGRPSTYASILQVLKDRKYVRIDKRRLVPEDRGRIVIAFLESFFARYVEYDFTADLEEQLDRVSNNEVAWRQLLREFWLAFTGAVGEIKDLKISEVIDALDEMLAPHIFPPRADGVDPRRCTTCGTGRLSLKLGKFGAFIGCSNYPECRYTRPFSVPGADGVEENATRPLGRDPDGLEVTLRNGRFGPYVQLGEAVDGEKPKRAGLPRGTDPANVDLEMALKLLSLPREVGRDPETGEPIVAGIGRFGSYVQRGKTYANLEPGDDVLNIGLNRAVTLIAEKVAKGGRSRFGGDPGRSLGEHPDKSGPVLVKNGRYGPYVTHDGINATLPSDKTPETITLEEALGLIAARAERTGGKRAAGKGAKARAAGKAETGKAKKTKGKAVKVTDATADADDGIGAEDLATATAKPKQPTSTARAKATKNPVPAKSAAKPASDAAPKRAKAGK